MTVQLLLRRSRVSAPPMPSRVVLAEAFGVGAGATLYDKSRYRSHGAITGAVWAAGLHGYCLDFDPTIPSYVTVAAAHTQLDFTNDDFSAIARVYVDNLTSARVIFQRGPPAIGGYRFRIDNTGQFNFLTYQAGPWQITRSANGAVVISTWYTLGFSRTGATITLFRNGVDATAVAGVHIDPVSNANPLRIGIREDLGGDPYDGKIEFLRIFRGIALADSEHLAWHNALA